MIMKYSGIQIILAGVILASQIAPAAADGEASAAVTVNGVAATYSGGTCIQQGSVLSMQIGVLPSQAPAGTHPDYFGAYIPDAPGHFQDGAITVVTGGKQYTLGTAVGTATATGAVFAGAPMMQPNVHVQGSFKC